MPIEDRLRIGELASKLDGRLGQPALDRRDAGTAFLQPVELPDAKPEADGAEDEGGAREDGCAGPAHRLVSEGVACIRSRISDARVRARSGAKPRYDSAFKRSRILPGCRKRRSVVSALRRSGRGLGRPLRTDSIAARQCSP